VTNVAWIVELSDDLKKINMYMYKSRMIMLDDYFGCVGGSTSVINNFCGKL